MKKQLLLTLITTSFIATIHSAPALADKPEWAGKGKPTYEQSQEHKYQMKEKRSSEYNKQKREYDDQDRYEKSHKDNDRSESNKSEKPAEENKSFQQKMKDLLGW